MMFLRTFIHFSSEARKKYDSLEFLIFLRGKYFIKLLNQKADLFRTMSLSPLTKIRTNLTKM